MFTVFIVVCTSAPILGAISSGYFGMKIGGYKSLYALPSCLLFAAIMLVFGLPFANNSDFYIINILLWCIMYVGGIMIPLMTGVML